MADDNKLNKKAYEDALKSAEKLTKEYEKGLKNVKSTQEAFEKMSTQLFGISGAAFFKEVPKTVEELRKGKKEASELKDKLSKSFEGIGEDLKGQFGDVFDFLKKGPEPFKFEPDLTVFGEIKGNFKDMASLEKEINDKFKDRPKELEKFEKLKKNYQNEQLKYLKDTDKFYEDALERNTDLLVGLTKQEKIDTLRALHQGDFAADSERVQDAFHKIAIHSEGVSENTKNLAYNAGVFKDELPEIIKDLESANKKTSSLSDGFKEIGKNFAADIIPSMMEYDKAISDAGKDFGFINTKTIEASNQMAILNSEAARFGMGTKETLQMMGDLGDELKTIDQKYLAESVGHFIAIEKATGISSGEITTIAGEMMRAGKSSRDVEDAMEGANKTAKMLGVNTKKVLQGVAKNIDKMRQMGFQGGVESLTKMAATAERLRMNVDEIFDVAKKARTIEGAMDMAAELQLAGGSFANIDPMSLLAAARKGPKELQKILTDMGGDIGSWVKNAEGKDEFQFDPVDVDRLQMVADATGQTLDSIQKGIQKAAEDNQKVDLLGLGSSIGDDEKNFLSDMTDIGKNGGLEMSDELKDLATGAGLDIKNVDELKNLSQDDMKRLMDEKASKTESLEKQALANQSFQESVTAFKDSVMSLFSVFEPVIRVLTDFMQAINSAGPWAKGVTAAILGLLVVGPKLVDGFGKFKEGASAITDSFKGFKEKGIKGIFSGATPKDAGKDTLPGLKDSKDQTPGGSKGGLQSLAEGLKAMGDKDVFKGIGAVALAGPALLLMLAGMPTVLLMGLVGVMGKAVEFGFTSLARGISAMGQAKGLIKGAIAMVIVGAALIPFAFALQMMSDVSWKAVGIAMVMMLGGVLTLMAIGAIVTGPGGIALLMGALALVAVGVALMAFGASLMIFATAANMMQGMEFGWLGDLGWNLLIAGPGLLLGGLALLVASPGLILGSIGLIALGVAAQGLAGIDWAAFASIGDALLSLVPGLIGFSIAGLMFANPITLLGMLMMIGNLGMLAAIMTPLAMSLNTGADGLDRFAEGLTKLQAAANSLDFERLEALKNLSIGMASSGAGGGLSDSVDKIVEALAALNSKGGGGGGGTKKIQVDLKLNGRDLQSIIIDDTEIVS